MSSYSSVKSSSQPLSIVVTQRDLLAASPYQLPYPSPFNGAVAPPLSMMQPHASHIAPKAVAAGALSAVGPQAGFLTGRLTYPPDSPIGHLRAIKGLLEPRPGQNQVLASALPRVTPYMDRLTTGKVLAADVDACLYKLLGRLAPLERGVVGPTGASSTLSFSVFGPIFGVWGFVQGLNIMRRAGEARTYLAELEQEIARRESRLQALQRQATVTPMLAQSSADLQSRLQALQAFRDGVKRSLNEQYFNMAFPGAVQVSASALILALAVDFAPTLGSHAALLPASVTAAVATAAASVLGAYAAASFLKNLVYFVGSMGTPTVPVRSARDLLETRFLREYNKSVRIHQAFYGLNTVSWGVYVYGAVALALISSGVAVGSHGAAVGAAVAGALAAVIWDVVWGRTCSPHNTMTPHLDRNYLDSRQRRMELWDVLDRERRGLQNLMSGMFAVMPPNHRPLDAQPFNLWKRLNKEKRYIYFWQLVPIVGGTRRLAKWAVKDLDKIEPPLARYMRDYNHNEVEYLRTKLLTKADGLIEKFDELQLEQRSSAALGQLWEDDYAAFMSEYARFNSMKEIAQELESFGDFEVARSVREGEPQIRWNAVRLKYLSVHGLLNYFITRKEVLQNPAWFVFDAQRSFLGRSRISNIRLTRDGLAALSARPFSDKMEMHMMRAVVNPQVNRYDIEAVLQMEAEALRKTRRFGARFGHVFSTTLPALHMSASNAPTARHGAEPNAVPSPTPQPLLQPLLMAPQDPI